MIEELPKQTSFNSTSSNYCTPCQSPASSLDSTTIDISLQSCSLKETDLPNSLPMSNCSSESSSTNATIKQSISPHSGSLFLLLRKFDDIQENWLQLIGIEQQIKSLGIQVTSLRENILTKLNDIYEDIRTLSNYDYGGDSDKKRKAPLLKRMIGTTSLDPKTLGLTRESNLAQSKILCFSRFSKLSAFVKGYLVRRLIKTERVQQLIQVIRDTTTLLDAYKEDAKVDKKELDFHQRLMVQLEHSLSEFHDIFFRMSKKEQMKIISKSRKMAMDKIHRSNSKKSLSGLDSIKEKRKIQSPEKLVNEWKASEESKVEEIKIQLSRTGSSKSKKIGRNVSREVVPSPENSELTGRLTRSGNNRKRSKQ